MQYSLLIVTLFYRMWHRKLERHGGELGLGGSSWSNDNLTLVRWEMDASCCCCQVVPFKVWWLIGFNINCNWKATGNSLVSKMRQQMYLCKLSLICKFNLQCIFLWYIGGYKLLRFQDETFLCNLTWDLELQESSSQCQCSPAASSRFPSLTPTQ